MFSLKGPKSPPPPTSLFRLAKGPAFLELIWIYGIYIFKKLHKLNIGSDLYEMCSGIFVRVHISRFYIQRVTGLSKWSVDKYLDVNI